MAQAATISDTTLIESFQAGCSESFDELMRRYETKVYNLALRLTRNIEDAQEVLQDVFVTVYRKVDGFEGKAKFSSWLYRITVNAAFMKLRKRRQDQSMSLSEILPQLAHSDLGQQSTFSFRADSLALNNEIKRVLDQAIGRLPEDYRAVFILRDVDGLSNKEVSDILSLTIPAVKSRLHRSRMMLRKRLQRFYQDYKSATKILSSPQHLSKQAA